MILRIGLVAASIVSSHALFFPQTSTTYDHTENVLNWDDPRTTFTDRVGILMQTARGYGNWVGTAIGPKHFITAAHVVVDTSDDFYYAGQSYNVVKVHNDWTKDFSVCEVDGVFPDYAEVRSSQVTDGTKMRMYGYGYTPSTPVVFNGQVRGWVSHRDWMPWVNSDLRYGYGRMSNQSWGNITWNFDPNDSDTDLQQHVCSPALRDSGGGIFVNNELAGIILSQFFSQNVKTDSGCLPGSIHSLFLPTERCSSTQTEPVNYTNARNLVPERGLIYTLAAVRTAAAGHDDWSAWNLDWDVATPGALHSTTTTIDTTGVSNPAPQDVYKSIRYVNNGSSLTFAHSGYTGGTVSVRIHFSSVPITGVTDYTTLLMKVSINGTNVERYFNPYGTTSVTFHKASILQFSGVQPNTNGEIIVSVSPETFHSRAVVSGVEITLE